MGQVSLIGPILEAIVDKMREAKRNARGNRERGHSTFLVVPVCLWGETTTKARAL